MENTFLDELIEETIHKAYNQGIDHAIKIVMFTLKVDNTIKEQLITELLKLKKL